MPALALSATLSRAPLVVAAANVVALGVLATQVALRILAPAPAVIAAPVRHAPVRQPGRPAAIATPTTDIAVASPASGTTGTVAPPPAPFADIAGDASVTPAVPFSLKGIAGADRGRALDCLTSAVYYEAASEPDDGQRAVAQVVLNRVRHPAFPATVCGVVYQGSERAGCQFSFACDGSLARAPSRSGWARAARNAAAVLTGETFRPVGLATHYHTFAVTPAWSRTLVMTDAVGAHFFHRWKGYWGTAAAFTRRYAGHEPAPGPHPAAIEPVEAELAAPVVDMPTTTPVARPIAERPAAALSPLDHTDSGEPLARWKDAGKPL